MSGLSFIDDVDFKKHITETINRYIERLKPSDLKLFNSNIVDPIKLLFDKLVYQYSWDELIKQEIVRQLDKSNNNDIGYFQQGMFKYIKDCTVPSKGWDVIYHPKNKILLDGTDSVKKIYVELKNKHNTMNSSSSSKTYIRMQSELLSDDECACFLVEVIAPKSQNIAWCISVDGTKKKHKRIRRVSIDEFYALITGEKDSFYKLCLALPSVIKSIVNNNDLLERHKNTVVEELQKVVAIDIDDERFILALYLLGFGKYPTFAKVFKP